MHRIGLIDFWCYTNEEFHFANGKMLLRGNNGSGKSITLQSFIPLLLDGNKNSKRIDPFGEKARRLDDYLLEEPEQRDDRIGYLYIEFKREDSDVFKTIGMGMHARRGKPLDTWYFVLEDQQRINRNLQLFENHLAISKKALKLRIQHQFIESQREYVKRVNDALFQFKTLEEYKESIELLLQVRTPKLSNSLKPTEINRLLSDSLQPLSEDELRVMSEAYANMDELQEQVEVLKKSVQAASSIHSVFQDYNYAQLFDKFNRYYDYKNQLKVIKNDLIDCNHSVAICENESKQLYEKQQRLYNEQIVLEAEKRSLGSDDIRDLEEEVETLQTRINDHLTTVKQKEASKERKANRLVEVNNTYKKFQAKLDDTQEQVDSIQEALQMYAEDVEMEEHLLVQPFFMNREETFDFSQIQNMIVKKIEAVKNGLSLFMKQEQQLQVFQGLQSQIEIKLTRKEEQISELNKQEQMFRNLIDETIEKIAQWEQDNTYLKLDQELYTRLQELVLSYEQHESYELILQVVRTQLQQLTNQLTTHKVQVETKIQILKKEIQQLHHHLQDIMNQKESIPLLSEEEQISRQQLSALKIAYLPLYKGLEFAQDVPIEVANEVEEILQRMNLLDVVFVHQQDRNKIIQKEQMIDRYIFINKNVDTLALHYIKGQTTKQCIDDLFLYLTSICKESQSYITIEQHRVRFAMVEMFVSGKRPSIYIGETSRLQHRQKQIESLQLEIQKLQEGVDEQEKTLQTIQQQEQQLQIEFKQMPQGEDLQSALQEVKKLEYVLQSLQVEIDETQAQLAKQYKIIETMKREIHAVAERLFIRATNDAFEQFLDVYQKTQDYIQKLEYLQNQIQSQTTYLETTKQDQEELQIEQDELHYEIYQFKQRIAQDEAIVQVKIKQLDELGFEQIRERLQVVQEALRVIPKQIETIIRTIATNEEKQKNQRAKIEELLGQQESVKQLQEEAFTYVQEEIHLGYIELQDMDRFEQEIKQLQSNHATIKSVNEVQGNLQKAFFTKVQDLQEYSLTMFEVNGHPEFEVAPRLDFKARYGGVKMNIVRLLQALQNDVEHNMLLIQEKEREIFQEILIHSISKRIRSKIQMSRAWVERMNEFNHKMDTSSGLRLSLQWKSKKASMDDEMDIEELVKLLERDARILKEQDRLKISKHFKRKVDLARMQANAQDSEFTFHQAMKDILDYRTWFEFKILFQKTNETKRELSNVAFFKLSGGEKAMSMYIPLFSAVAAKFTSASVDAPMMIALDEAFAGMDDKNIGTVFALIHQYGFDYLMNSQVLWGDYPGVDHLAIYDLQRPDNASFVAVMKYYWNGHTKVAQS